MDKFKQLEEISDNEYFSAKANDVTFGECIMLGYERKSGQKPLFTLQTRKCDTVLTGNNFKGGVFCAGREYLVYINKLVSVCNQQFKVTPTKCIDVCCPESHNVFSLFSKLYAHVEMNYCTSIYLCN